jgi:hypothetical protein
MQAKMRMAGQNLAASLGAPGPGGTPQGHHGMVDAAINQPGHSYQGMMQAPLNRAGLAYAAQHGAFAQE